MDIRVAGYGWRLYTQRIPRCHGLAMSTIDTNDRREYYRIKDTIALEFKLLTGHEALDGSELHDSSPLFNLLSELHQSDFESQHLLRHIGDQDRTLAAAKFQRDAAVEARPQALSAFLPQFNAQAGRSLDRTKITSNGNAIQNNPTDVTRSSSFFNRADQYQVTLSQTIWSFEAWRQLKQADSQVALAEATYRSTEQALILRVAQAYFNVLSASDALRTGTADSRQHRNKQRSCHHAVRRRARYRHRHR